MSSALEFLVDWCIRYLENKDMVRREIESVEEKKEGSFKIKFKNGLRQFLVIEDFSAQSVAGISDDVSSGIFILNSPSNVNAFLKEWGALSKKKKLMCYFINPFSNMDKAWIIIPYVHAMVCDPDSLEMGIKTMSEMVEYISPSDLAKRLE